MITVSNPRLQGVKLSGQSTAPNDGSPRTVLAVEPLEQFAVAFNDEQGRLQRMVVLRVGDMVYVPPGSIEWSASLKPAANWLKEAINRKMGKRAELAPLTAADIPASDGVDVLGNEGATPIIPVTEVSK